MSHVLYMYIKRNLSNVSERDETVLSLSFWNNVAMIFFFLLFFSFFFSQSFPRLFSSFRVRRAHAIRVIVCPRGRRHYHRNWMKFSCRLTKNFIRAPCVDRYVFPSIQNYIACILHWETTQKLILIEFHKLQRRETD